jgi:nucleotide-binding universal stress UspA family protein
MFENVLVGVKNIDGDRDSLRLAQALVSQTGRLTLAYVQVVATKPAPDSGSARYAATRRYALEQVAALRDESQLDADVVCEEARSVRHGLHELVHTRHVDLLVIGASRQDDLTRDVIAEDTREVLDDAPCAVAVAPVGYASRQASLTKIGVAYDESPESDEALMVARRLVAKHHATLSAFHAASAPRYVRDPWDVEGQIKEDATEARERIAKLGDVEAHAAYGDTLEELVRYGRSVDLLVLGSHKYGPINRFGRPSTAQQLADEATCPLLVLANGPALDSRTTSR